MGEQDVADQQGAFCVPGGRDRGGRRPPFFVSLRFAAYRTKSVSAISSFPQVDAFKPVPELVRVNCPPGQNVCPVCRVTPARAC